MNNSSSGNDTMRGKIITDWQVLKKPLEPRFEKQM